jgi:hypothetical protein
LTDTKAETEPSSMLQRLCHRVAQIVVPSPPLTFGLRRTFPIPCGHCRTDQALVIAAGKFMEARKVSTSDPPPFQLSLRIRHPSMDPAELSHEFKIKAEHSFRAGDPRPSRSGIAAASVRTESYWLGALNPAEWPADISFPEHPRLQVAQERLGAAAAQSFDWALSLSATRFCHLHAELLRRIRSEGGQISLLVALSPGSVSSFSLVPEVSRVFGEFGVTVEFEFAND